MTAATPEQIENIKNRLGLATEHSTTDDIVAKLERLRTKNTATQKAYLS